MKLFPGLNNKFSLLKIIFRKYFVTFFTLFFLTSFESKKEIKKDIPLFIKVQSQSKFNIITNYKDSLEVSEIIKKIRNLTLSLSKGINNNNEKAPYAIAHQLYIPMLYAFNVNNKVLIKDFDNLITIDLINQVNKSKILSDLHKKVFYFFIAEYLRNKGISSNKNKSLYNILRTEILNYWLYKSGKNWINESADFKGKKERIKSILDGSINGDKSFYSAITDNELFIMASGISLSILEMDSFGKPSVEMKEISDIFYCVMRQLVKIYPDGSWLFQPDIWKDHKDFKSTTNNVITWDASHFSRFPAYLYLMQIFYKDNLDKNEYIYKLQIGLSKQFINKVANYDLNTKSYHFSNYMSGDDSNYRVGHRSKLNGYGSSSFYLHIFFGWWELLKTKEILKMYKNINNNFEYYIKDNPQVKKQSAFYKETINITLKL